MITRTLLPAALLFCFSISASAQDAAKAKIPPDNDAAPAALKASTRHGEYVDIPLADGTKLKTFVVYPERKEKAPVVLVIHEIFGLTPWVQGVADQLAADGFIAVAPDFLSGKGPDGGGTEAITKSGGNVRDVIRSLSKEEVNARLDAARAWAIKHQAATDKTATIGFCWGGSQSFNYAVHQPKLNAAIVYYGSAPTDKADLGKIIAPVLGLYGGDDARITKGVEPTTAAMKELSKPYDPKVYDAAGHGFLRQRKNEPNQKAADAAWAETIAFLKKNLE
jgi:carboxymethylenebutenolidase